jgi:hypothetical protein
MLDVAILTVLDQVDGHLMLLQLGSYEVMAGAHSGPAGTRGPHVDRRLHLQETRTSVGHTQYQEQSSKPVSTGRMRSHKYCFSQK